MNKKIIVDADYYIKLKYERIKLIRKNKQLKNRIKLLEKELDSSFETVNKTIGIILSSSLLK